MTYHNAVKRLLTTPQGSDPRSAERVSLLCQALNVPVRGLTVVEILGESGKSACASMLSQALLSRGYRVGTLTTPFSHTMTECIAVNCAPVSMDTFTEHVSRTLETVSDLRAGIASASTEEYQENDTLSPIEQAVFSYANRGETFSPFADELLLTAALSCFAESACQIAVIEIPSGDRGGAYRLPLAPAISVITATDEIAIATQICRTLDKRSRETVTALQSKAVYSMISDTCAKFNCRLTMPLISAFYPADFAANRMRFFYKNAERTLHSGAYYQALNMLTVCETLEALKRQGFSADPLAADFHPPVGNAGVELQFAFLSLHPTIITDPADTPNRMSAFAASLHYHSNALGENIILVAEESSLGNSEISELLDRQEITVHQIVRATAENARRTMKPIIKALTAADTILVTGSRPFVYETARAIGGLMS